MVSYNSLLAEAKKLHPEQLSKLITKLMKIQESNKARDAIAEQLEQLASSEGFTMAALGFVRHNGIPSIKTKKQRTLSAKNQTYVVTKNGVELAPARKLKQLKADGAALRYDQLTSEQQSLAAELVDKINNH